jgi:hypothetical protein
MTRRNARNTTPKLRPVPPRIVDLVLAAADNDGFVVVSDLSGARLAIETGLFRRKSSDGGLIGLELTGSGKRKITSLR